MPQSICIGVIGANEPDAANYELAYELGTHIAGRDATLVCGGLGGIMEAASKGAREHGGTVIGILPGASKSDANQYVSIALPTGMGIARNTLVVNMSDVLIAFPGSYGTLSEIALALKSGKPVVSLNSWALDRIGCDSSLFHTTATPEEAVRIAVRLARGERGI